MLTCKAREDNRTIRRRMRTYELVFVPEDVGDIHVVGGGRDIFLLTMLCGHIEIVEYLRYDWTHELLAGENLHVAS